MGYVDKEGFLFLEGRADDVVKTSNGEKVPCSQMEKGLKDETLIKEALIIANKRKFVSVLLWLHPEEARRLAGDANGSLSEEELAQHPAVKAAIDEAIAKVNNDHNRPTQIRTYQAFGREPTVAHGEITETMKLRRKPIQKEVHTALIEGMYEE